MSDQYALVRFQIPTAGTPGVTTTDITHPSITETVKGAVFWTAGLTGTGTANHARCCIGFLDDGNGSTPRSASVARRAETQASAGYDTINWPTLAADPQGACIVVGSTSATTEEAVGRYSAIISGGVRVVWDTIPSVAYEVVCLIIAGVSNAKVFQAGQTNEEDPGFQPDYVLFAQFDTSLGTSPAGQADYPIGIGFAVSNPTLQQSCIYGRLDRLSDPSDADTIVRSDRAFGNATGATPTDENYLITAFDSAGFDATLENTPSGVALAVKSSGPFPQRKFATTVETLTSGMSGVTSFTGLGIRPQVVIGCASLVNATGTMTDGATAATETLFVFDDTSEFSIGGAAEAGVSAVDAFSLFDTKALRVLSHTGTDAVVATRASLDGLGFSLNFTTASNGRIAVLGLGALPAQPLPKRRKPQRQIRAAVRQRKPQIPLGVRPGSFISLLKHFVRQRVQRILRLRQPRKIILPATEEIERVSADENGVIQEGGAVRAAIFEGGAEEGIIQE